MIDQYPENLPKDFVKVNAGVPSQIGSGQVNPDATEKEAQLKEAEEASKGAPKPKKKTVKKGRK